MREDPERRRAGWALPVALACTLGGCAKGAGDPEPALPSPWSLTDGTRLQARYLVSEDGARVFDSWFDSARGEPCTIARGDGGRFYCFPDVNAAAFRDASCRDPVGQHLECPSRYTGVRRGDHRCNNQNLTLWQEGEPIAPQSVYQLSQDFCVGPGADIEGSLVTLVSRMPITDFVGGSLQTARPDLRVGPQVVQFDDGAVAPLELFDGGRNRLCVRVETTQGIRCLPESVVYVGQPDDGLYFGDHSCSVPVGHALGPACLQPSLALVMDDSSGCARVKEAHVVGARLDPRAVFTGATCHDDTIMPGHFYLLGDLVDLTNYPELTVHEVGTGRIRVRTYASSDDVSIPALGQFLYDTSLAVECKVAPASDGILRCLPLGGPDAVMGDADAGYADPQCSQPLARYNRRMKTCGGPSSPTSMVARAAEKRCQSDNAPVTAGRWEIFQLGAKHEGPVYRVGTAGCAPIPASTASTDETPAQVQADDYFEIGAVVPPTNFVSFHAG